MKNLDCRGQRCPIPIAKISQAFKTMELEEELEVMADDMAFKPDLDAWIKRTGNALILFESNPQFRAILRKTCRS